MPVAAVIPRLPATVAASGTAASRVQAPGSGPVWAPILQRSPQPVHERLQRIAQFYNKQLYTEAGTLLQSLLDREAELGALPGGGSVVQYIHQWRAAIYSATFGRVYGAYKQVQAQNPDNYAVQARAVEPFLYCCIEWAAMLDIVRPEVRASWMMTASKAWSGVLQAMAASEDPDQIDMNLLLALKDIIPEIECRYTRLNLLNALGTVFRLVPGCPEWAQRYRQELCELSRWDAVITLPEAGGKEQRQVWQLALQVRALVTRTGAMAHDLVPAPGRQTTNWPEAAGDAPSSARQPRACGLVPDLFLSPAQGNRPGGPTAAIAAATGRLRAFSVPPPPPHTDQEFPGSDGLPEAMDKDIQAVRALVQTAGPVRAAVVCIQCVKRMGEWLGVPAFPEHEGYVRQQMMPLCMAVFDRLARALIELQIDRPEPDDYNRVLELLRIVHKLEAFPVDLMTQEGGLSRQRIATLYGQLTEQALLYLALQMHVGVELSEIQSSLLLVERLLLPEAACRLGCLAVTERIRLENQLRRLGSQPRGKNSGYPGYRPPAQELLAAFRRGELETVASLLFADSPVPPDRTVVRLLADMLFKQLVTVLYSPCQQNPGQGGQDFYGRIQAVQELAVFARRHSQALQQLTGVARMLSVQINAQSSALLASWNATGTGPLPTMVARLMKSLASNGWLDTVSLQHWEIASGVAAAVGSSPGEAIARALKSSYQGQLLLMARALQPLLPYQPLLEGLEQARALSDRLAFAQRKLYRETGLRLIHRWQGLAGHVGDDTEHYPWVQERFKREALTLRAVIPALSANARHSWVRSLWELWSGDLLAMGSTGQDLEAQLRELWNFAQLVELTWEPARHGLKAVLGRVLGQLAERFRESAGAGQGDDDRHGLSTAGLAAATRLCHWVEQQLRYDRAEEAASSASLAEVVQRCRQQLERKSSVDALLSRTLSPYITEEPGPLASGPGWQ